MEGLGRYVEGFPVDSIKYVLIIGGIKYSVFLKAKTFFCVTCLNLYIASCFFS